MHLFAIDICK